MKQYDKDMNMQESLSQPYSFRLFKRMPSFLSGFAALLDFSPNGKKYNYDATPSEADINSLRDDWYAIGADLRSTIKTYERERAKDTAA